MNETYRSQFRLPLELAERLRDAAEASGRSMNAEVLSRLQDSFQPQSNPVSTSTRELMAMAFFAGAAAQEPGQSAMFIELLDRMFPATGNEDREIERWIEQARDRLKASGKDPKE